MALWQATATWEKVVTETASHAECFRSALAGQADLAAFNERLQAFAHQPPQLLHDAGLQMGNITAVQTLIKPLKPGATRHGEVSRFKRLQHKKPWLRCDDTVHEALQLAMQESGERPQQGPADHPGTVLQQMQVAGKEKKRRPGDRQNTDSAKLGRTKSSS